MSVSKAIFATLVMSQASLCRHAEPETIEIPPVPPVSNSAIPWESFSGERVAQTTGRPLFINFRAEWSIGCKVNEVKVLSSPEFQSSLAKNAVIPLWADLTQGDPEIAAWLEKYQRTGVPTYIVVPADRSKPALVLPEYPSLRDLTDALDQVGSTK